MLPHRNSQAAQIIVRNVFRMKYCQLDRFSFSLSLFWTMMCLFCEDLAPTFVRKQRGPGRPQHAKSSEAHVKRSP